jgi:hypothetical protein
MMICGYTKKQDEHPPSDIIVGEVNDHKIAKRRESKRRMIYGKGNRSESG